MDFPKPYEREHAETVIRAAMQNYEDEFGG